MCSEVLARSSSLSDCHVTKGLTPDLPTSQVAGLSKMGCCFSKPVPKPPEPTLPRFTTRAVHGESPNAGRVKSKRDSAECFADLAGGVQATTESNGVQATDILNVKNLSSELTMITNWYQLGLYLNLQTYELDKIQQDHAHQGNDRQRMEMLALWLQYTPNATWEDVVSALQQMGKNRVAENVHQKHNRRASKLYSTVSVHCHFLRKMLFLTPHLTISV